MHWTILPTDGLFLSLLAVAGLGAYWLKRQPISPGWQKLSQNRLGMTTATVLLCFLSIAALDSIHLRATHANNTQLHSVLDRILKPNASETTYSAPFAHHSFSKITQVQANGNINRINPPLKHIHPLSPQQTARDITLCLSSSLALSAALLCLIAWRQPERSLGRACRAILTDQTPTAWRSVWLVLSTAILISCLSGHFANHYHLLGTDKVGYDVFYLSVKSIRTGLIIGTLTTLIGLPLALLFGVCAGYFGGWVDDAIQHLYTTLSAVPGVLLISAAVLALQVYLSGHQTHFATLAQRADLRLLALCAILGLTGWPSLCRLLRGETLKLREMDFVTASKVMGASSTRILLHHILPNVMHIVIITTALDFSGLVLAEAVLSYVGAGVDPTTISWGNMINAARLELARSPIVWWPLLAAFGFMFTLVLSANLFADSVRDAFDPKVPGGAR